MTSTLLFKNKSNGYSKINVSKKLSIKEWEFPSNPKKPKELFLSHPKKIF